MECRSCSWWTEVSNTEAGEAIGSAFDFLDNYGPLIAILSIPATTLISYIKRQINIYFADPDVVAPPPPPASPDWVSGAKESFFDLAQEKPGTYLVLDLGLAFAVGVLAFYWKDMMDWIEAQRLRGSYQKMDGEEEEADQEPVASAAVLRMQLYKAINMIEEVRGGSDLLWC